MTRIGRDTYLERLAARSARTRTVLCVGIDPDPAALPPGFSTDVKGVEAFVRVLLDAAVPYAAAVKPNLAFFEAFGSEGLAVLERLRASLPSDVLVIADAKRGDIGTTSERHAAALFDRLGADAVTVSPYLGEAAIAPLLERPERFAYVLARTSNPGAGEFQDLRIDGEPLWSVVARRAAEWGPGGTVGLVVGATAPAELSATRAVAPGLAFLVPGVGAQGGSLDAALDAGPATRPPAGGRPGGGLLVNVSRAIANAGAEGPSDPPSGTRPGPSIAPPSDLGERLAAAARDWAGRLPVLP